MRYDIRKAYVTTHGLKQSGCVYHRLLRITHKYEMFEFV
ncbi:unnamed protein product [Acanthoscelides obtectus]|uniref:Uncharacterized protein n=1 Tax=Acanthoscelides obtectus TaxID=200917 RepID=A0A9P0KR72_ACAOB|nr:unnamed protein product [Acanthoscelides obtectus]